MKHLLLLQSEPVEEDHSALWLDYEYFGFLKGHLNLSHERILRFLLRIVVDQVPVSRLNYRCFQ